MGASFGSGMAFSLVSGTATGNPFVSALTTGFAFAAFNGIFYQVGVSVCGGGGGADAAPGHASAALCSPRNSLPAVRCLPPSFHHDAAMRRNAWRTATVRWADSPPPHHTLRLLPLPPPPLATRLPPPPPPLNHPTPDRQGVRRRPVA